MTDPEIIQIPGPRELLQMHKRDLDATYPPVEAILKTPGVKEAMASITTMDSFDYRMGELREPHLKFKPQLEQLIALQLRQFGLARSIVANAVSLHVSEAELTGEPLCCYWGAHVDHFTQNPDMPGRWIYVGQYTADDKKKFMAEFNVQEADEESPLVAVVGQPTLINYDVTSDTLPVAISPDSINVSILKTVGSGLSLPGLEDKFWEKIVAATKVDGLVITTNSPPYGWGRHLQPFHAMLPVVGTTVIDLNAPPAANSIFGGYYANRFEFYTLNSH